MGEALCRRGGEIGVRNSDGQVAVQITADGQGKGYIGVFNQAGRGKTLQPQPSDALGTHLSLAP
ncbi:MAG: hypothetical protein HY903_01920 [Deltaproteobacteria bacterium]|nr:hypothetical protein [Deltaproteobacteria bacterium]